MTLDELKEHLRAAGLTPICVANPPPQNADRLRVVGGLAEYLEAVQAVGAKSVIIYSRMFAEDDFLHFADEADNDFEKEGEQDAEPVDLSAVNEQLRKYREFIGRPAMFCLSTYMQSDYLDLVIEEPWWREFMDSRLQVTDALDEALEETVAAQQAQEEAEVEGLLARLHELASDPKFMNLPTQKAMLQYALRQIPALDSIDQSDLRSEIQEIKAKIDAAT